MADTRERLIELLAEFCPHKEKKCVGCDPGKHYHPECKTEQFGKVADHLIDNGVTFYVHKTENTMCLYCNNSMSADAPDGSQVLVCFDCDGHEGKEMIVGEDEWCANYT